MRGAALAAGLAVLLLPSPGDARQESPPDRTGPGPAAAAAATLEVRLSGAAGAPVTGAEVRVRPAGSGAVRLAEEAPGAYVAHGLPPGPARVDARLPDGTRRDTALALSPGTRAVVRWRTPAAAPPALEELVARIARGEDGAWAGHAVDRIELADGPPGPATLGERLGRLPGVEVRAEGGREVVTMRGSRPEGVLVLLDGLPVNDPVTGVADLSGIPASTLESAAVVRGAASGPGPGGLAGVVVLRSRAPDAETARLRLEAGSFGARAAEGGASTAGALGALSASVRYEESRNDFPYENRTLPERPEERRRNADVRAVHAAVTARAAGAPVALRVRADAEERGAPGRMSSRVFDRARWTERGLQASLGVGEPGGPRLRLGARGRSQRYADPRRGIRQDASTSEVRLEARLPLAGGAGSVGAVAARQAASADLLEGTPERLALGVDADWSLPAGPVRLVPALAADLAAGEGAVSPSVAAELPLDRGRAWARAGQALRLPALGDLHLAPDARVHAAADLRPERVVLDLEVGAAWEAGPSRAGSADGSEGADGPAAELRAAAFLRRTEDPIVWFPSPTAVWSPRNLGELTALGAEVDGAWRPAPGWRLDGSLTWQRSRVGFGDNGNPLPHQPAWTGRLAAERAAGGWRLRGELEASSSRTTSLAATHRLAGFALVNLAAARSLELAGLPLTVDVRVRNVLDDAFERVTLYPEPGRSLEVGLSLGPLGGGEPPGGGEADRKR